MEILFTLQGGKKRVDQHAAVWVPDNEANVRGWNVFSLVSIHNQFYIF